jgi:molybdopterin-guanine dinucleotide biosynthesis protein A
MERVSAAILVGGRARRLDGQLKPLLRIGDHTILDRQRAVLARVGLDRVLLIGSWRQPPVSGVRHFPDVVDAGALGGLYSALLAAWTPVVLVLAGDLPFVSEDLLRELLAIEDSEEARVPRTKRGWHPLCATYRRAAALSMKKRIDRGALKVSDTLTELRVREVTVVDTAAMDAPDVQLMNVNTPDDLRQADRIARIRR